MKEIAGREGRSPFDALVDIACTDGLRTIFSPMLAKDTDKDWEARARVMTDDRALVGGSDAGAHLDNLATFNYPTVILESIVRERGLLSLEAAVQSMTDAPARLYGLFERGRLAPGMCADVVVFDPATIGSADVTTRFDLPAGASRLYATGIGISHVFVNGEEIVSDGEFTDARPGHLLRSGRDTR